MSQDALLGLLAPLSEALIGGCVLVVLAISTRRLLRRGPSRMGRALIVTGGATAAVVFLALALLAR